MGTSSSTNIKVTKIKRRCFSYDAIENSTVSQTSRTNARSIAICKACIGTAGDNCLQVVKPKDNKES